MSIKKDLFNATKINTVMENIMKMTPGERRKRGFEGRMFDNPPSTSYSKDGKEQYVIGRDC